MSKAESTVLTLELERTFAAPPSRIYDLITKAENYILWFGGQPDNNCQALEWNLEVGGSYRIHVDHGSKSDGYTSFGKFLRLDAAAGIIEMSFQWEGGDFEDSLVRYELIAKDGGTLLRFHHSRLPHEKSVSEHTQGWEGSFVKLDHLI